MKSCVVLRLRSIWGRATKPGLSQRLRIGYARVSTKRQNLAIQVASLRNAACDVVYMDTASGGHLRRRALQRCLPQLREGDAFVVWRLDRLSRKLTDLVDTVERLTSKNVRVEVLNGRGSQTDFSQPEGRFVLGVLGSFAQLEHEVGSVRTRQAFRMNRDGVRGQDADRPAPGPEAGRLGGHFRSVSSRYFRSHQAFRPKSR